MDSVFDFRGLIVAATVAGPLFGSVAPLMLPKNAERLSDRFEQALSCDPGPYAHRPVRRGM